MAAFARYVLALLLIGVFLGTMAGLLMVGAGMALMLLVGPSQWSLRVDSQTPCALAVVFGDGGKQTNRIERFAVQRSASYGSKFLMKERGGTRIHAIEVSGLDGRKHVTTLDVELPPGSDLHIQIDGHLNISTSIDYDYEYYQ
jgi:hypothetical protein